MSHRISRQQSTGAHRVARAINNPNEPTACRTCGSIYFMEMTAQMYTTGGYGLRAVSTTPMTVYMCPCGEILTPAGLNNGNPRGTSPRCRRNFPYSDFRRHFGMKTTWYLQSQTEWFRLSNVSIATLPFVCLAAHVASICVDTLPYMSHFYCLPASAGGPPLVR